MRGPNEPALVSFRSARTPADPDAWGVSTAGWLAKHQAAMREDDQGCRLVGSASRRQICNTNVASTVSSQDSSRSLGLSTHRGPLVGHQPSWWTSQLVKRRPRSTHCSSTARGGAVPTAAQTHSPRSKWVSSVAAACSGSARSAGCLVSSPWGGPHSAPSRSTSSFGRPEGRYPSRQDSTLLPASTSNVRGDGIPSAEVG